MQRTLALVVLSIVTSIAVSLLVTTVVKALPRLNGRVTAEDVVEP